MVEKLSRVLYNEVQWKKRFYFPMEEGHENQVVNK